MKLIEYLKEVYGYDNPIILKDLRIGGKSKSAIRQELYRETKLGNIQSYGNGVYYFYKSKLDFMKPTLSLDKVLLKKYMKKGMDIDGLDINRIGYVSGFMFLNQIGISPQVPNFYEITTNNISCNKRTIYIRGIKVVLRKPKAEINFQNFKGLQFFDLFKLIDWEDLKNERKLNILKQYVSKNLRKNDLKLLQLYSTETIKKITESGLIYDFR